MNNFLFNVLIHGTSYSENGKGVSINKGDLDGKNTKNTILFFHIDDENSIIKQELREGENICDLFIYISYKKTGNNKNNINDLKLLILAELKGSKIEHAIEQIKQTYEKLKKMLKKPIKNQNKNIKWIAIIVASGSANKNDKIKEHKRKLKSMGIELILKTGKKETIDITNDIKKYL
jgi:hypothetical protein